MAFPDLLEQYPELAEGIGGKLTANQPLSAVTCSALVVPRS